MQRTPEVTGERPHPRKNAFPASFRAPGPLIGQKPRCACPPALRRGPGGRDREPSVGRAAMSKGPRRHRRTGRVRPRRWDPAGHPRGAGQVSATREAVQDEEAALRAGQGRPAPHGRVRSGPTGTIEEPVRFGPERGPARIVHRRDRHAIPGITRPPPPTGPAPSPNATTRQRPTPQAVAQPRPGILLGSLLGSFPGLGSLLGSLRPLPRRWVLLRQSPFGKGPANADHSCRTSARTKPGAGSWCTGTYRPRSRHQS